MKKIMALLTILMCFASTNVFAQLKEVRGVQTRVVEYRNDRGVDMHGFEFKNENNYPVWVEAELWIYPYSYGGYYDNEAKVEESVRDTKSFTLYARETYVWKCGNTTYNAPGVNHDGYKKYYVKYKAYKAE